MSNDIGSFLGPPPGNPRDDSDLYARWVQLGTFQPALRLHSSAGNRLPWDYPESANSVAASCLRLREALVPYTYTLADQSANTGLPMTRPLYLDYPAQAAAYDYPGEYLYGPDMLVAPVTTPGNVTTENVWFPPGTWTDWFTGATFHGPSVRSLTVPLDRMPVFVKAGGIVPEQAPMDHVGARPDAPLTLRVYPGEDGQFTLYQDAGTGTGYQRGQYSLTPITSESRGPVTSVTIHASRGSYPGSPEPAAVDLTINPATPLSLSPGQTATVTTTERNEGPGDATGTTVGRSAPSGWTVTPAGPVPAGSIAAGASATQSWTMQAPASSSGTQTAALQATASYTRAGLPEQAPPAQAPPAQAPPPAPVLASVTPSTTAAGSSVTLNGQNFGATQGSSYLTLAQGGTNWGAPYDGAKLTMPSWSDTSITVTLPPDSGSFPLQPGTATITVTVRGQSSAPQTITVTG